MNERITENLVRGYFNKNLDSNFIIEEQQSKNPRIDKLLKNSSKYGNGKGYPEFIVSYKEDSNFIIVVECKANIVNHKSDTLNQYTKYAVDGALLYASYLSKEFDVIAIGVSGDNDSHLKIDSYVHLKGKDKATIFNKGDLFLSDIRNAYIEDDIVRNHRYENLLIYTKQLNETLHGYKIKEDERCQLLSGILIALNNKSFLNSYKNHTTGEDLAISLITSVMSELKNANIPNVKVETLEHSYNFIKTNNNLTNNKDNFVHLISEVNNNVNSFYKTYKFYDVFGEFYIEFLRYANTDKGLGIVLTPVHITELFCELANITKDSIVFDNCCGTGGFLITAMRMMLKMSNGISAKENDIKSKQIIGIEYQNSIFTLLCSNMILHGDGKTNLYNKNCFEVETQKIKNTNKPTIGFLNPPYKTKKTTEEEFEYIINNLSGL